MNYPIFAIYFFIGFGLTIGFALARLASFRVPWLVICAPAALGLIGGTWPWLIAFFYWPYPHFSFQIAALAITVLAILAVLIRRERNQGT